MFHQSKHYHSTNLLGPVTLPSSEWNLQKCPSVSRPLEGVAVHITHHRRKIPQTEEAELIFSLHTCSALFAQLWPAPDGNVCWSHWLLHKTPVMRFKRFFVWLCGYAVWFYWTLCIRHCGLWMEIECISSPWEWIRPQPNRKAHSVDLIMLWLLTGDQTEVQILLMDKTLSELWSIHHITEGKLSRLSHCEKRNKILYSWVSSSSVHMND